MRPVQMMILCVTLLLCTAIASGAFLVGHRYTLVVISGSNAAWKIDRLTGQAYGCEESEFGPFCIPAPDHIKHGP